jgi:hypothetical protein
VLNLVHVLKATCIRPNATTLEDMNSQRL